MEPNHQQTFQAGMVQDVDPHLQPANTYRDADNGQLLYNPDAADVTMGHGMAFVNAVGNRLALGLPTGYELIGSASCSMGTLLMSTNGQDSEIGLWSWDSPVGEGNYQTLYNDRYDRNALNVVHRARLPEDARWDRLNWRVTDSMDIVVSAEDSQTERVYWTDRRHAVHTLDLRDGFDAGGKSWHQLVTGGTLRYYPKVWSLHAFRERSDLVFPRLKLLGRGRGRLLSGAYQIAIQYRHKNGHESVFSPLTRRVFVTAYALDDDKTARQTGLRANHHNRVMGPSGKMTGESLRWEIDGIDVRWESVRVAVLYFQSPDKPYRRILLDPIPVSGTKLTVDVTQLVGDELTDSALNQRYDNVLSAGTLASYDNRLIAGNLQFLDPVSVDAGKVRFTPVLRGIDADQTTEPTFKAVANAISGRLDGDPITNSTPGESTLTLSAFTGSSVVYPVTADYASYKGQVYDWLLKGYFRGETAEFGCLVLDRSGQPLFVEPLAPFTFPEQYAEGPAGEKDYYSLTKLNVQTNRYELQALGLKLSGIRLPVAKLYDQDGRLNVSGWMIVRRKRNARIRHQGVVFPVTYTDGCRIREKRDYKLFPLPTHENRFALESTGNDQFPNHIGTRCDGANSFGPNTTAGYYLNYHSPDVLIEESFEKPQAGDELKHVGIVHNPATKGYTVLDGDQQHTYSKSYSTRTDFARLASLVRYGRPGLGDTSRITLGLIHNLGFDETYKEFDKDNLLNVFETQTHPQLTKKIGTSNAYLHTQVDGLLQRNSLLLKAGDWKSVDAGRSEPKPPGRGASDYMEAAESMYRLVNYLQPATQASADTEPYFSTGHYQPISEEILKRAGVETDSSGLQTHYVFDEVEVWGGDCYVNYFGFTRLYPFWSENCQKTNNLFHDYAVSHVLPIESVYNLALRWGRSFEAQATKQQVTSCEGKQLQGMNGISAQQTEDWQYNTVLKLEEATQFYHQKDPEQEIIVERPNGFQWSPEKSPGQRLDAFRLRYAGDYGAADGNYGSITRLVTGSFQNLYVWQQRALGVAPLNAAQYDATAAGTIVISSGKVFTQMVYLSRESGTEHPESVWVSKGQMGGWDARGGLLLRHSQAGLDELSRLENINDSVQKLSVNLGASDTATLRGYNAVVGVKDSGDVLISFFQNDTGVKTLVYSPAIGAFTGSLPGIARRYGQRGKYLFGTDAASRGRLYTYYNGERGRFFDRVYPTRLRFIVNPSPTVSKRFDNGYLNVNKAGVPAIVRIRQWTPNGGPAQDHTILGSDERIEFVDNCLAWPMHEVDWEDVKQPLRDHYAIVEITIDNERNIPVELLSFGCALLT